MNAIRQKSVLFKGLFLGMNKKDVKAEFKTKKSILSMILGMVRFI
jgi:hypothetical protein